MDLQVFVHHAHVPLVRPVHPHGPHLVGHDPEARQRQRRRFVLSDCGGELVSDRGREGLHVLGEFAVVVDGDAVDFDAWGGGLRVDDFVVVVEFGFELEGDGESVLFRNTARIFLRFGDVLCRCELVV